MRGFVSLAVLALAAAMCTRLAAGGRAAVAAALDVLAVEGAALAIADARRRLPGDHVDLSSIEEGAPA